MVVSELSAELPVGLELSCPTSEAILSTNERDAWLDGIWDSGLGIVRVEVMAEVDACSRPGSAQDVKG